MRHLLCLIRLSHLPIVQRDINKSKNRNDRYDATAKLVNEEIAKLGDADAQNNLGFMYANGKGVPQDYILGHMWWNLAASSGQKNAISGRDAVSKRMTSSQLEKAQDLARECVRKNYKGC